MIFPSSAQKATSTVLCEGGKPASIRFYVDELLLIMVVICSWFGKYLKLLKLQDLPAHWPDHMGSECQNCTAFVTA